jgi:hypothetical protein
MKKHQNVVVFEMKLLSVRWDGRDASVWMRMFGERESE